MPDGDRGGKARAVRRALLGAIALLYALSIPWYRAGDAEVSLVSGLPDWVAVALGCYVAIAILNAAAWLVTEVPDPPAGPERRPPR